MAAHQSRRRFIKQSLGAGLGMALAPPLLTAASAPGWKAGVARENITPDGNQWLAGYAARTRPAEGTLHDLWAKAVALEDADGRRTLLITSDLLGFTKELSDRIRADIRKMFGLSKAQVILSSSHTHSGPVLENALVDIYPLDAAHEQQIRRYSGKLAEQIITLAGNALKALAPALLYAQNGVTRFQVNRRNNDASKLPDLSELKGPNDFAVPVIKVARPDGSLQAVIFGYACHPTTLDGYYYCGDYPGFAQLELEQSHPGATALFFQGAGGDQNPLPRHSVPLARQYGRELAAAVERVLEEEMKALSPQITTAYTEIPLKFSPAPTAEALQKLSQSSVSYYRKWALRMMDKAQKREPFPSSYPFPVQAWRLGEQALFVLGGEVTVEYAVEIKKVFGRDTFIMAYANDVMGYIPSETILREGGYEGDTSQMVYGLPSRWEAGIETVILKEVKNIGQQAHIPER